MHLSMAISNIVNTLKPESTNATSPPTEQALGALIDDSIQTINDCYPRRCSRKYTQITTATLSFETYFIGVTYLRM